MLTTLSFAVSVHLAVQPRKGPVFTAASTGRLSIGLGLSLAKFTNLVSRPHRRLQLTRVRLFLNGQPTPWVGTFTYVGLLIDDRVSWQPTVKATLAIRRHLLVTMRKRQGQA